MDICEMLNETNDEERLCWICYQTPGEAPSTSWVKPCKCRGSLEWVHRSCLQMWIETGRKNDADRKSSCRHCRYVYRVADPYANSAIKNFERFYMLVDNYSTVFSRYICMADTGLLVRRFAVEFNGEVDDLDFNVREELGHHPVEAVPYDDDYDPVDFSPHLFGQYSFCFSAVLCVPFWVVENEVTQLLLRLNGIANKDDVSLPMVRIRPFTFQDFVNNVIVVPACARVLAELFYTDTSDSPIWKAFVCTSAILLSKSVANVAFEYIRVARSKNMIILDYDEINV